jgi:hypothetical protein
LLSSKKSYRKQDRKQALLYLQLETSRESIEVLDCFFFLVAESRRLTKGGVKARAAQRRFRPLNSGSCVRSFPDSIRFGSDGLLQVTATSLLKHTRGMISGAFEKPERLSHSLLPGIEERSYGCRTWLGARSIAGANLGALSAFEVVAPAISFHERLPRTRSRTDTEGGVALTRVKSPMARALAA